MPGPPEVQATRELDLAATIEPHMAAHSPTGGPAADEPVLPPRDIVPALNEIAALQKERSGLKSQVQASHLKQPPGSSTLCLADSYHHLHAAWHDLRRTDANAREMMW